MSKSKLYTKTGDKGETSLVSGTRLLKSDNRIDLYGEVDELNSTIGLLTSRLDSEDDKNLLRKVQHNLFNLGSCLACEKKFWEQYKLPKVSAEITTHLEARIDHIDSSVSPLKNFILPGGAFEASLAHMCRVISRRVERKLVSFSECPENSLEMINRLSDYFFVLARYLNKQNGVADIPWEQTL